jgi:hypothetical protein
MYATMTRAEEILAFTRSTFTGFASRIQQRLTTTLTAIAFRAPQRHAVLAAFRSGVLVRKSADCLPFQTSPRLPTQDGRPSSALVRAP